MYINFQYGNDAIKFQHLMLNLCLQVKNFPSMMSATKLSYPFICHSNITRVVLVARTRQCYGKTKPDSTNYRLLGCINLLSSKFVQIWSCGGN